MSAYDQNSRYYNCDVTNNIPQANLLQDNYVYNTTTVLANEECRPDLISYRVYNTPAKWWIIARFNAIISPEEIRAGMKLRIPKI